MPRHAQHLLPRALLDNATTLQHRDAVGQMLDHREVARHEHKPVCLGKEKLCVE